MEPWQAQTIHRYLCINPTKQIEDWDLTALGHRLDNLAEVIVIDECCKVPTKILMVILDYPARRTCQVVCCGDCGQILPWGNKASPHQMLKEWAGLNVRQFDTDYRSLCEVCSDPWSVCSANICPDGPTSALHTVKERIWCQSDTFQLNIFRAYFPKIYGSARQTTWVHGFRLACFGSTKQTTPISLLRFVSTKMTASPIATKTGTASGHTRESRDSKGIQRDDRTGAATNNQKGAPA